MDTIHISKLHFTLVQNEVWECVLGCQTACLPFKKYSTDFLKADTGAYEKADSHNIRPTSHKAGIKLHISSQKQLCTQKGKT
jgi:hypothetical protein